MAQEMAPLVWLDMEMSGLDPEVHRILEVAIIVTDGELNTIAEAPVWVVHQSDEVLDAMDSWNKGTHGRSGLIDKVRASKFSEADVEAMILDFLRPLVPQGTAPLAGNTVHQDRRFMVRHLPALEAFFHYRNLDVSTVKELANRWAPEMAKGFFKESKHLALDDVRDSIAELRYYREHFLRLPEPDG